MFSWWGGNEPIEKSSQASRRTVKTKQVQLEVIGGSSAPYSQGNAFLPSTSMSRDCAPKKRRSAVSGPPKLPRELITCILLMAAELIAQDQGESSSLLRLASVDKAAHHAIFTHCILHDLRLKGVLQVKRFAQDLQNDVLGLRHQAKKVKRLTIRRRAGDRTTLEFIQAVSLFSGVEELAQFEKATYEPLKVILSYCTNIEHLSLEIPASVLDDRPRKKAMAKAEAGLGSSLKELITLLSVYGGDLNEALWHPGSLSRSRWSNLTHLQLHGPRFRLETRAAIAISKLPSLTHLALIMPLLIHPNASLEGETDSIVERLRLDNARDALGRYNVLQVLVDALGHRLEKFLLVCHDVENYVGNVQRLGSWFRTLHWRCNETVEEMGNRQRTRLTLVTAKPWNELQTSPHPSLYSKWMLQRAEREVHWSWNEDYGFVGHDVCEQLDLSYRVESWAIPVVFLDTATDRNDVSGTMEDAIEEQRPNDGHTAGRWNDAGDEEQDGSRESSDSEELSGIDNLD